MFFKISVLKVFIGKHLCWSLFLIKLRPEELYKYSEILKNSFLYSILSASFIFYQINCLLIDIFYLKLSLVKFDYWLRISVPYSECPTLHSSVFCTRCSSWNSIYTRSWAHLLKVENSRQMWLSVSYSECSTPYSSMFCSTCPTWNSIYIQSWADLYWVEKILP